MSTIDYVAWIDTDAVLNNLNQFMPGFISKFEDQTPSFLGCADEMGGGFNAGIVLLQNEKIGNKIANDCAKGYCDQMQTNWKYYSKQTWIQHRVNERENFVKFRCK